MTLPFAGSTTLKVLGIALLALLMLIPLAQVEDLVQERAQRAAEATTRIAARWGDAQYVGGVVLVVPVRRTVEVDTAEAAGNERPARRLRTIEESHFLLPERLALHSVLRPELRSYGIHSSVVYLAELQASGEFDPRDFAVLTASGGEPQWSRAQLRVPIADVHGIRRASALRLGDAEHAFGPSDRGVAGVGAIMAPVPGLGSLPAQPMLPFSFALTLAGSERIALLPLARTTEAHIEGAWGDPGFDGDFLPAQRRVAAAGFSADWQVLDLNRTIPQHWTDGVDDARVGAFGVSLLRPVGPYQRNTRAGKYGVLFIVFTFATFFLFEVRRGLRLHPLQYLLVGAALCTFYVLLLALSEHVGFVAAYAAAAAAIAVLIGGYAASVLRQRRMGLGLGVLIGLVYALLYGLISSEDYALLMGAFALFIALAAVMLLTRRVDWYALGARGSDAAPC